MCLLDRKNIMRRDVNVIMLLSSFGEVEIEIVLYFLLQFFDKQLSVIWE